MAEEKLFFDDVSEGDAAPEFSHELTRTDLVMYAGASGDFNPMHTDEVDGPGGRAPERVRARDVHRRAPRKALTDYVGVGNLRTYKVRFTKQTWPGEMLTTHVTVAKKYDEGREHRVDLECSVDEPGRRGQAARASPSPRSGRG